MPEDIILTTAATVARKKWTPEEEDLVKELTRPRAQIDVLIPNDMDSDKFELALSAVSRVIVKATMQREAMFPVLGRLLLVASLNPELWNKKFERFEDFRLSLADRFGLGRQTSYDALNYARRWAGVLPPSDYVSVGRRKLKMISQSIGVGDEGKATARKLLEFAKENTEAALGEKLDKDLHVSRGSNEGAYFKFPCSKKQQKLFDQWFADPRVQAVCGSERVADILEHMQEECTVEWITRGEQMIEAAAEAAQQSEKETAAAQTAE
jgi:hypothetical protein